MAQLPAQPNVDQLRRQAKELRRAAIAGNADAVARVRAVAEEPTLASAQLVLAREHGFRSWPDLKAAVEAKRSAPSPEGTSAPRRQVPVHGARDFLDRARSRGWEPPDLPVATIFTSQTFITRYLENHPERFCLSTQLTPTNGRVFLTQGKPTIAVACLGVGAPALVMLLEHLAALGVRTFIAVGPAPAVSPQLAWGDCAIATAAVRDDGVSHHYLERGRHAYPDRRLTDRLRAEAAVSGLDPLTGTFWTVPSPYRASDEDLQRYQDQGVLVTDLSTAALFAAGSALGVSTASAAITTTTLNPERGPAPDRERSSRIFTLLDVAVRAVVTVRENGE